MKFMRSRYILQNYREMQRRYHELIESKHNAEQSRSKRNADAFDILPSQYYHFVFPHHKSTVHRRVSRNLNNVIHRQLRRPFQGEEAYAKYMETIRQKYQKYVKNILGYNNLQNFSSEMSSRSYDNRDTSSRLQPSQVQNLLLNTEPTASSYSSNVHAENKVNRNYPFADNIYYGDGYDDNQRAQYRIVNNNFVRSDNVQSDIDYSIKPNVTELIAKLKSQIIRRKRSAEPNSENGNRNRRFRKRANANHTASLDAGEIDENLEGLKRGKAKGPCEVSQRLMHLKWTESFNYSEKC